jgi:hypothetical protein
LGEPHETKSRTDHSRREIQLTPQSIPVSVSYLHSIDAHPIEQGFQTATQSPELLGAVSRHPLPIRMVWPAIWDKLLTQECVETHAGRNRRKGLTQRVVPGRPQQEISIGAAGRIGDHAPEIDCQLSRIDAMQVQLFLDAIDQLGIQGDGFQVAAARQRQRVNLGEGAQEECVWAM